MFVRLLIALMVFFPVASFASADFSTIGFGAISWGPTSEARRLAAEDADSKADVICRQQSLVIRRITEYEYSGERCVGGWERICRAYARASYTCL
jgi:hypothetical protein